MEENAEEFMGLLLIVGNKGTVLTQGFERVRLISQQYGYTEGPDWEIPQMTRLTPSGSVTTTISGVMM